MPHIEPKDELSSLRSRILEYQKARIDLLKYKLFAVAVIGAFALKGDNNQCLFQRIIAGNGILLCLIPFVCVFVDLCCYHNTLRMMVIGKFLRNNNDPYEKYVSEISGHYLVLEDWALRGSTIILSGIITGIGLLLLIFGYNYGILCLYILTGVLGLGCSLLLWRAYINRINALKEPTK